MRIIEEINGGIITGMRAAYYGYLSEVFRPRLEKEIKKYLARVIPVNLADEMYKRISDDIWYAMARKITPFLDDGDGDAFRKVDLKEEIEDYLSRCIKEYDMKLPEKD